MATNNIEVEMCAVYAAALNKIANSDQAVDKSVLKRAVKVLELFKSDYTSSDLVLEYGLLKSGKKKIWWEKSVEWEFIHQIISQGSVMGSPLGGTEEQAYGDGIFKDEKSTLFLIEFKINENSFKTEISKYGPKIPDAKDDNPEKVKAREDALNEANMNFENAEKFLEASGGSHLFVYGRGMDKERLLLAAQPYWSASRRNNLKGKPEPVTNDIVEHCLKCGSIPNVFDTYLSALADYRYVEETVGSASGGRSIVAGVGKGGWNVAELREYLNMRQIKYRLRPEVTEENRAANSNSKGPA